MERKVRQSLWSNPSSLPQAMDRPPLANEGPTSQGLPKLLEIGGETEQTKGKILNHEVS